MQLPSHGANPADLYRAMKSTMPNEVIDFSENVNDAGVPAIIATQWASYFEKIQSYPEPHGEPFLSAVADFHHMTKAQVLLGNGAAEIFTFLARRYSYKHVLVVHPTFSEYEATLRTANAIITQEIVEDLENWQLPVGSIINKLARMDALYLCTPNNPTGVLPPKQQLLAIIAAAQQANCEVVIDEAFMDFVGESASLVTILQQYENVFIVRSMTKMFAIPGIRLGYVLAQPQRIAELSAFAPHWHINALAAHIGAICLQQQTFISETIQTIAKERERLTLYLQQQNCRVTSSVTNYLCFALPEPQHTARFFAYCLQRGIVLRHSENFLSMDGKWLRVGIKKSAKMAKLYSCLATWFEEECR